MPKRPIYKVPRNGGFLPIRLLPKWRTYIAALEHDLPLLREELAASQGRAFRHQLDLNVMKGVLGRVDAAARESRTLSQLRRRLLALGFGVPAPIKKKPRTYNVEVSASVTSATKRRRVSAAKR